MCQVTSNAYADPVAVEISMSEFSTGSLHLVSYARPGKLFTANEGLFTTQVAELAPSAFRRMMDAVIHLLDPRTFEYPM